MHLRLLSSTALALGVLVAQAASAQAQSYYAREQLTIRPSSSDGSSPATPSPTPTPSPSPAATWATGAWSEWSSQCSISSARTRSVTCQRSGSPAADSECAAARPASSEVSEILAGCTYSATGWTTTSWSSTCSTAAVQTESATCTRFDGIAVAAAECASRGIQTTRQNTQANLSGCTYTATAYAAWGACTGGSQSAAVQTCRRSDGTSVATSFCSPAVQTCSTSVSCASLVGGRWGSGKSSASVAASTTAQATTACTNLSRTYGAGVCGWDYGADKVYYFTGQTATSSVPTTYGAGALCQ